MESCWKDENLVQNLICKWFCSELLTTTKITTTTKNMPLVEKPLELLTPVIRVQIMILPPQYAQTFREAPMTFFAEV